MLRLAETHPQMLAQLGVSPEQIQQMVQDAERSKELANLSQEEKQSRDIEQWKEWLTLYK